MTTRGLTDNIEDLQTIAPAVATVSVDGTACDLRGAQSAAVLFSFGAIAGAGNMTVKVQESDTTTGGDFTDVAADQLEGTIATPAITASRQRIGYKGYKRYIRAVATLNSGTSVAVAATVVRGSLDFKPATA